MHAVQSGLIQPSELHELMKSGKTVRIVDGSYVLGGPIPYQPYVEQRIGDAVFFNIDDISDKASPLPHMLPTKQEFEKAVSALGISNDDLVVVYGQTGPHMGPARVWWSFRVFGHYNVCVLDGGLPGWIRERLPVNTKPPPKPIPGHFKAGYRPDLVRSLADMADTDEAVVFDARPYPRFSGEAPEPRPGLHSGHLPGSHSTPGADLIDPETNRFKSGPELVQLFRNKGFDGHKPVYAMCGSGVTACAIALALYTTGYANTAVYDGSFAEWGKPDSGRPVAVGAGGSRDT